MPSDGSLDADDRFKQAAGIIETDLGSELILLDPTTQEMFSLNPTGSTVWRTLSEAPLRTAVDRVVDAFEVDRETAMQDVVAIVLRLRAAGLLLDTD
jgi:hypothetical protein